MKTFLDDLFGFLDDMIDSGAEVHIVDKSDPDHVVEHVFNNDDKPENIPFADVSTDVDCPDVDSCAKCPGRYDCEDSVQVDLDCEDSVQVDLDCEEYEPDMWGIPDIRRVVFNDPATIIFWEDNTKTVVKCMKGEKFERYAGFIAACAKKLFGSTCRAKAIMNELAVDQIPTEKKPKEIAVPDLTEAFVVATQAAHDEAIQEAIHETLNG